MQEAINIMARRFLNACWSIGWQGSPAQSVKAAKVAFRALQKGNFKRAEKLMMATPQTKAIWAAALS